MRRRGKSFIRTARLHEGFLVSSSDKEPSKKQGRRSFLSTAAGVAGGLAVGAALGYSLRPAAQPGAEIGRPAPAAEKKLPKDTVRIGLLGIKSGLWATYGEFIEQAGRMAADEINAAGGILGSKIELAVRDEQAPPGPDRQARDLIEVEKCDFITGVDGSGNVVRIAPVMAELNKILIVSHASTPRLTEEIVYKQGIKHAFRVSIATYHDGILAAHIAKDLPVKRWAGINPDYEFGRMSWALFRDALKKLRPDVEFTTVQWAKFGTTDFTPFIGAVQASGAEALYTSEWALEAATLHKQASDLGLYKSLKAVINPLGYSTDVAYALGANYPTLPLGTWVSGRYVWPYPPSPINEKFVKDFKTRWGKYPAYSAECTYTAIYLIKQAIEKTGSLDVDKLIKAIEGSVIASPAGARWIRPEDHQAIYEVPFGRIAHRGAEIPMLDDLTGLPAWLYFRNPPFDPPTSKLI